MLNSTYWFHESNTPRLWVQHSPLLARCSRKLFASSRMIRLKMGKPALYPGVLGQDIPFGVGLAFALYTVLQIMSPDQGIAPPHGIDGIGKPFEPIDTGNENILSPSASISPRHLSEITSWTPFKPLSLRCLKEAFPALLVLLGSFHYPDDLPVTVFVDSDANEHRDVFYRSSLSYA